MFLGGHRQFSIKSPHTTLPMVIFDSSNLRNVANFTLLGEERDLWCTFDNQHISKTWFSALHLIPGTSKQYISVAPGKGTQGRCLKLDDKSGSSLVPTQVESQGLPGTLPCRGQWDGSIIDWWRLPWAQNRIPKGSHGMFLISPDSVRILQLLRKTKNNDPILLNIAKAGRGGLGRGPAQEEGGPGLGAWWKHMVQEEVEEPSLDNWDVIRGPCVG